MIPDNAKVVYPDAELVDALARLMEAAKGTIAEAQVAEFIKVCSTPIFRLNGDPVS